MLRTPAFGLYIHWPFCASKCPYCDFNSHVSAEIDTEIWRSAYLAEIRRTATETDDRILDTVFFGGGTPSLMSVSLVSDILEEVGRCWRLSNDLEVTLEANPGSVEAARFAGYRAAGVNRVSLGLQALNDQDLRRLGRLHSVDDGLRAFAIAREAFDRTSFDLIYARQDQSLKDWEVELTRALDLGPRHLSLYQLTIEDGTAFGDRYARGGLRGLPDEDLAADMFLLTQQMTEAAGLPAYEISNHAVSGDEARHNLIYWTGGDYVGIGPGAHGRITIDGQRLATECPKLPATWLEAVRSGRAGELPRTPLSAEDVAVERLMMGLRLRDGIEKEVFETFRDYINPKKFNMLIENDLLEEAGAWIRVTDAGRLVLNSVLRELLVSPDPTFD